ncbi:LamG-like jellyroll fold domain-containing protein [Winogradskyella sp.]|uniref:LamG-like jellyroll fold domain-containing protein n=1 Tax=Winogradskyella sp. TaxID=1883156 RepID=UPI0025DCA066|nr:LamG-like jellyroll fold domain-containing protein [Winogradskyella sp.]
MKTLKQFLIFIAITCFSVNVSGQCTTPPADMVSWWQAENNANDLYGNNNGTEQNGISYATGTVNNAFYFDGVDDVIVVPHSNNLDLTGNVTIELWVRQTGFDNAIQTVICKGAGDVPNNEPAAFLMRFEYATTKFLFKDATGAYVEKLGPTFEDWQWHHYAYVRQGNMHILYADGFEFGWESFTSLPESTIGLPLTIGAQYHNPTNSANDYSYFFAGEIDEVGVYNRALSQAEIQSIYNAGALGKCSDGLSIEDDFLSENEIKIYPNPVKSTFTLDISKSTILANEYLKLRIFDLSGRLVKQVDKINIIKRNIDINDLNTGIYLYQIIKNGRDMASGKIIKNKI